MINLLKKLDFDETLKNVDFANFSVSAAFLIVFSYSRP